MVSEGSGSWLEYIEFDGKVYWTINDDIPNWEQADSENLRLEAREHLLESDSANRPDL